MNQPADDRSRGLFALRAAGVGLGVLGAATFGNVAGWFTLEPVAAATIVATASGIAGAPVSVAGTGLITAGGNADGASFGRVHTRTGGR